MWFAKCGVRVRFRSGFQIELQIAVPVRGSDLVQIEESEAWGKVFSPKAGFLDERFLEGLQRQEGPAGPLGGRHYLRPFSFQAGTFPEQRLLNERQQPTQAFHLLAVLA